ncbi:MAG: bifunctional 5,6,7,8-tetrahydromethanopterin hydro-lyase/3-hexulose-6-phosphate synthase [Candidatus Hydrothermarchaeota archaeon]
MMLIGEALVGKEPEIAHIDLIIGDKEGPVGIAFTNSLANLSAGHTPLLAVIRPNLIPKPATLIVPKVTIKDLDQASKIFGPAQVAVAKAVADSVEEGIIPEDQVEDLVIICSVFLHPSAKDLEKIYHYNYGATKLAIKRAMTNYPPLDKIMYEKDRAVHPVYGIKRPRLWRPPYLQIALDIPNLAETKRIVEELPKRDMILLEAGTPLIKRYGVGVIRNIREIWKDAFIIADLKTLDVGKVEVDLAFEETADAVVASGLASKETIDNVIYEAHRLGIYAIVDMMNVKDPVKLLNSLEEMPDVAILHRSIDREITLGEEEGQLELINEIKKEAKKVNKKILVAVAGGMRPETTKEALESGADIIIVGRYITQSKDIKKSAREFLEFLGEDTDLMREHIE